MTVTDQIKFLNRKIKRNESQYDLDREAAKISALSSNNLDKYELLTGEDLGLKPSTIEQAKFEYSPLGKIFNKGLSEEDKKEGTLKGIKNIKDKNEELINTLSATNKSPKNKTNVQSKKLIYDVNHSFAKLKNIDDIKKLSLDSMFSLMKESHKKFNNLNKLKTRTKNNEKRKQEVLTNVGDIYNELYDIYKKKYNNKIDRLSAKNKIKLNYKQLRLSDNYLYSSKEEQKEQEEQNSIKVDYKTLIKQITDEEKDINDEVFKKYFKVQRASNMLMFLNKNNDTEMKNQLVNLINSGLKDLKEEIKKMSNAEIENEDPQSIVNIAEKILKFNEQNQQGQGIKVLTPNQMLNRLPIALGQLQAGNNSNKLKNEIRQLLYSLYHLKNITEQVYKSLIGII